MFAAILPVASAGAAGTDYELTGGWIIHGATAKCPGDAAARTLTGPKAAAFIEAWYPASIYGSLTEQKPPAAAPVCNFLATATIKSGKTASDGTVTYVDGAYQFKAFYVSQGNKAWVGLPPQEVGPGANVLKLHWYVAIPRVGQAFRGEVDPISNATTTTKPATVSDDSSSDSSAAPWIIAGVAAVALLGVGGLVLRSRRRSGAGTA